MVRSSRPGRRGARRGWAGGPAALPGRRRGPAGGPPLPPRARRRARLLGGGGGRAGPGHAPPDGEARRLGAAAVRLPAPLGLPAGASAGGRVRLPREVADGLRRHAGAAHLPRRADLVRDPGPLGVAAVAAPGPGPLRDLVGPGLSTPRWRRPPTASKREPCACATASSPRPLSRTRGSRPPEPRTAAPPTAATAPDPPPRRTPSTWR